jgi:ABC-type branched-subunit amino acid transport system substrate-binding protein
MLTSLSDGPARAAITLLNEAGIGTVSLGDAALQTAACSAKSDFYPNGHATAVVVDPAVAVPPAWAARYRAAYGIAPTAQAYRAYLGVQAILKGLAQPGVATHDAPARLNRDALAAALVRGACA